MKKLNRHSTLFLNLTLVLILMSLCRFVFFIFNKEFFESEISNLFIAFLHGIRFDISVVILFNLPIILLSLLPFSFTKTKIFRKIDKYLFVIINSVLMLFNNIDVAYYRYTLKRSTVDIFRFAGSEIDLFQLLPHFLYDYWYLLLIWILFIIALTFFHFSFSEENDFFRSKKKTIGYITFVITTITISVISFRGGLQLKPINIITASAYGDSSLSSLVLNTPFTIIKTIGKSKLEFKEYFSEEDIKNIYTPEKEKYICNLLPDTIHRKKNIVIIVVESLSQEHIEYYNPEIKSKGNFTPFINSLCDKSMVFNGIANGKKSNEGIPALCSGIATLMSEPFINSLYLTNPHNNIASILNTDNYQTMFFHGGTNGTMGFDNYSKLIGFDKYYGRTEYNNESDYDGSWGIWDEEFLKFSVEKISENSKNNFLSLIFTLSSHHPYKIPEKYKDFFPKGDIPIFETIAYADYALKNFFEIAEKKDWYKNTIFIITSDHSSQSTVDEFRNNYGIYRIPFIFYDPEYNLSQYSRNKIFQQIDLLPTLMAYLNIKEKAITFGTNILDTNNTSFAIQYRQPSYQWIENNNFYIYNNEKITAKYNIIDDKLLKNNLLNKNPQDIENTEKKIKAFIQQYNNRLILNQIK